MAQAAYDLVLASQSPRRRELLEQLGLRLKVVPANIDESAVTARTPAGIVEKLSLEKAKLVAANHQSDFVLAADTIVTISAGLDFKVFGKPSSAEDAAQTLHLLSGQTHQVHTGYTIVCKSPGAVITKSVRSDVTFNNLSAEEIAAYVASGDPMDKAGAYGIQGFAACFVSGISGSYSNIVGLPLAEVFSDLKALGVWTSDFLSRRQ